MTRPTWSVLLDAESGERPQDTQPRQARQPRLKSRVFPITESRDSLTRPPRTIRLILPKDAHGVSVFSITATGRTTFYAVREIPCEIGGRGFEVHRLGLGALYHVRVGRPRECSCECKGFLYHGHCRHILGLLALLRERKL